MPELLAALAVAGLVLGAATPVVGELLHSAHSGSVARALAADLSGLRWKATSRARFHGLFFEQDPDGAWSWVEVADGNGNGLRTAEIRSGVDPRLGEPRRLENEPGAVTLGFPGAGPFPAIPPAGGTIAGLDDPVKFGPADIISFGPRGTASSGTLYLTDHRSELLGVRVYGPTARVRVWRWHRDAGEWRL